MILEGIERLRRQRIDRISTNEVFDVKNLRIGRGLGARAGPQGPLSASAPLAERSESFAMKNFEEAMINQFGIRDGNPTKQGLCPRLCRCKSLEGTIHHGVHPTDEKRSYRSDLRRFCTA